MFRSVERGSKQTQTKSKNLEKGSTLARLRNWILVEIIYQSLVLFLRIREDVGYDVYFLDRMSFNRKTDYRGKDKRIEGGDILWHGETSTSLVLAYQRKVKMRKEFRPLRRRKETWYERG